MINPLAIWSQRHGSLKAEIARVNDTYQYSVYDTASGTNTLVIQDYRYSLGTAKKAVFVIFDNYVNDSDAIDTDLEDQRAEMLQEMAEEEHHCLEADESIAGTEDA